MDLNEHELAELEERLYSSVHHASIESCNTPDSTSMSNSSLLVSNSTHPQKRVVTDKIVINDARQKNSKLKRYWSSLQQNQGKTYPGIQGNKSCLHGSVFKPDASDTNTLVKKQTFRPYQSILGLTTNDVQENVFLPMEIIAEVRQRKKKGVFSNAKSISSINTERNRKMEQLKKIKTKRAKAQRCRQQTSVERLVATIEIESSSEEDGEYRSPDPIKQEIETHKIDYHDLEDSDPDEVVVIPSAPPPLVCIESSDDEAGKKFTHPNTKKKNSTNKKLISPRCLSPSNSSIMSDDFIGQNDRARLNDSFIEGIANDEELDCAVPHTVRSLLSGDHRELIDVSRVYRAPSISSEGTVATSSDTTDPDKRNGMKTVIGTPQVASQPVILPKYSSTPKQLLPLKKQFISKVTPKSIDTDSIYTVTSNRKSRATVEVLGGNNSSDDSNGGNISSHSKRSKSNYSDNSSKSLKKSRKKLRRQETGHYSDEDFALRLTDIVQAMSENGDNSERSVEFHLEAATQDQTLAAKVTESSRELFEKDSSSKALEIKEHNVNLSQIAMYNQVQSEVSFIPTSSQPTSTNSVPDKPTEVEAPPTINLSSFTETGGIDSTKHVHNKVNDPEYCWNDEMRQFYHSSWNCEDFNVSTVLFNMPRSSKNWPIVHLDKYPDPPRKEIICNNCGERGHMRYKCRNRPKPGICYMCGQTGHQEPRCPNTLCLKCGEKTRNFVRGCQSCAREQNMSCHLCGIRGHGQRNCPDKWRRYHSTIDDNVPLTQNPNRNPNAKHCCICSRSGHQAHRCNAALRIFGQLVPTTEVKSYQPMYNINESYCQRNQNTGQKFNMFSDLTDYQLNFDGSFAMNEKSFYNRFAKSVGLFEKKKQLEEKVKRRVRREAKRCKHVEKLEIAEHIPLNTPIACNKESKDIPTELGGSSTFKDINETMVREDSNYSFSEFFEEPTPMQFSQTVEPSPDFIPLTAGMVKTIEPLITEIEPKKLDAKIFLTKQHAKVLLAPNGSAFLKDASKKFALQLSVLFQSVGNVLMVNGLSKDQDNFHNELVKFLNDVSHQNEQIMYINNVPKVTEKTILYIVEHLRLLTRSYENVRNMFRRYQHFEQQGNAKTTDKIRRNLNIILFGQFGLREGRDHLNKLQVNLKALRNSKDLNVSMDFRNEINQHIRYIFTAYDHADYADILDEFDELKKNQRLNKIKTEDLDIPSLPSTKNVSVDKDNFDEPCNLSRGLNFEDNNYFEQAYNEDLILNTSDRSTALSDQQTLQNEPKPTMLAIESAAIAAIRQQHSTPKSSKLSAKKQKVESLMSECRLMIQQLDCRSIKMKFDRISCQGQEGHISRANFRTLIGIRSILRNKLQFRKKNTDD